MRRAIIIIMFLKHNGSQVEQYFTQRLRTKLIILYENFHHMKILAERQAFMKFCLQFFESLVQFIVNT